MSESLSIPKTWDRDSAASILCVKLIGKHNEVVRLYEAEHELRLRLEVKLKLANEELARLRAR